MQRPDAFLDAALLGNQVRADHLELPVIGRLAQRLFTVLECFIQVLSGAVCLDDHQIEPPVLRQRLQFGQPTNGFAVLTKQRVQDRLMGHEQLPVLFLAFAVTSAGFIAFLYQVVRTLEGIFEQAFIAVQQHHIELNFHTIGE